MCDVCHHSPSGPCGALLATEVLALAPRGDAGARCAVPARCRSGSDRFHPGARPMVLIVAGALLRKTSVSL
eukprot:8089671-Alexandrium_andersonii.AAC.1